MVLYKAPDEGSGWRYDGQPMYKADDNKYLFVVTSVDPYVQ